MSEVFGNPLMLLVYVLAAIVVVYVMVRVGAVAWFRTRREHAQRMMREMMKGDE